MAGATRAATVSAGSIMDETQTWTALPGQPVVGAAEPARLARQLRAGGPLDVRLAPEDSVDRPRRYSLRRRRRGLIGLSSRGVRGKLRCGRTIGTFTGTLRGEPVDPALVYFRCQPTLETGSTALRWVNDRLFAGAGRRHPEQVAMSFYTLA